MIIIFVITGYSLRPIKYHTSVSKDFGSIDFMELFVLKWDNCTSKGFSLTKALFLYYDTIKFNTYLFPLNT